MKIRLAAKVLACELARPILRKAPRGAIRLLTILGGGRQDDPDWLELQRSFRVFYDSSAGATVISNLREWGGRWHYYPGRYYDRLNQLIIRKFLKPGGLYVDVGANLGIHTLLASKVVGASGKVYAFEPNPKAFAYLSMHLAMNNCTNVVACQCALSDERAHLTLRCEGEHLGTATLRAPDGENPVAAQVTVPVRVGDDVLSGCNKGMPTVVKIDVEGWEHRVVRGLRRFLEERAHAVVSMEITPRWLKQAGSSKDALFAQMAEMGYTPRVPRLERRYGLLQPALGFRTDQSEAQEQFDVLFTKESNPPN